MITDIINEYREHHHKPRVFCWNGVENDFAKQHCYYMAKIGRLEHAPDWCLNGKSEAVAMCTFRDDVHSTVRYLIFDIFHSSPEHRDIILHSSNVAYGFYLYNHIAYMTIRGWQ